MDRKIILAIVGISLLLIGIGVFFATRSQPPKTSNLDSFAQCLTQKQVTMYGSASCSHCLAQKRSFGSSFQYVTYVECPANPKVCTDKNILGYPTWTFPDGSRLEGEVSLSQLSEKSGCQLP